MDWSLLEQLPFLQAEEKNKLETEFGNYVAVSSRCSEDPEDLLLFFNRHRHLIPTWSETAEKVALVLPSSASAERAVSKYRALFDRDGVSLEETREATLMSHYNGFNREKGLEATEHQGGVVLRDAE